MKCHEIWLEMRCMRDLLMTLKAWYNADKDS